MPEYALLSKGPDTALEFCTCPCCLHVLLGGICISALGATMHFVYEWSGCNTFAAVFCAVNESVYEHIKIMLFPTLLWWCVVAIATSRLSDAFNAATCAMYLSLSLLLLGDGLAQIAEYESLAFDISLFVFCIFCGQAVGFVTFYNRWLTCYRIPLLALVIALFTCTLFPPRWSYMFEDQRNHTYGRPEHCS